MQSPISATNFQIIENGITIDFSLIKHFFETDKEVVIAMLELFQKNVPQSLEKIDEAVAQKQWKIVFQNAHSLKSSFSIIQVQQAFELAKAIEMNARNGVELDSIEQLLQELKIMNLTVQKIITNVLKQLHEQN